MALKNLNEVQEIKNIAFLAKQVVEGFIVGMHKSPFHGFSVEFAEHREYNPGESTKNIDWKVYAKTEKLYTKRYDEETNLRCQLVLDTSSSMYFPYEEKIKNKLHFSTLCIAGLIELFCKQRDAVGLSLFSENIEEYTKAGSSILHRNRLYSILEQQIEQKTLHKKTAMVNNLHAIAENTHQRSLVIIFSDMFKSISSAELSQALQHLRHKRHEVILFHVIDKALEIDFEFDHRPYQFIDMESGEKIKLHTKEAKANYKQQMQVFEQKLKLQCAQYKIDYVQADISKNFSQILTPYLLKRTKMQ